MGKEIEVREYAEGTLYERDIEVGIGKWGSLIVRISGVPCEIRATNRSVCMWF